MRPARKAHPKKASAGGDASEKRIGRIGAMMDGASISLLSRCHSAICFQQAKNKNDLSQQKQDKGCDDQYFRQIIISKQNSAIVEKKSQRKSQMKEEIPALNNTALPLDKIVNSRRDTQP
jgi:hypothetical protein